MFEIVLNCHLCYSNIYRKLNGESEICYLLLVFSYVSLFIYIPNKNEAIYMNSSDTLLEIPFSLSLLLIWWCRFIIKIYNNLLENRNIYITIYWGRNWNLIWQNSRNNLFEKQSKNGKRNCIYLKLRNEEKKTKNENKEIGFFSFSSLNQIFIAYYFEKIKLKNCMTLVRGKKKKRRKKINREQVYLSII